MRPAVPPPHGRVRESYELERDYARRILEAPAHSAERRALLAEAYDRFGAEPHQDQSAMVARAVARGLAPGGRVLEIGCGYGALVARLAAAGFDAFGTDVSSQCVDAARERLVAAGIAADEASRRVRAAELTETPFAGSFAAIVLDNVIEHVAPDEIDDALAHCLGLLAPAGRLLVLTPHRFSGPHDVSKHFVPLGEPARGLHLREYSFGDLDRVLRAAGFARVDGFPLHPRLTAKLGFVPPASRLGARKAMALERIVPRALLRLHVALARALVALLFPAVCVAVKASASPDG